MSLICITKVGIILLRGISLLPCPIEAEAPAIFLNTWIIPALDSISGNNIITHAAILVHANLPASQPRANRQTMRIHILKKRVEEAILPRVQERAIA